MIYLTLVISILYCAIIGAFILGFGSVRTFKASAKTPKHSFSIIIPFRDEAKALPDLLKSLKALNYPKENFEVIFVDDESKDHSVKAIESYFKDLNINFNIVKNKRKTQSPKKDAICTAIQQAKHHWIATTDADCTVPKKWLKTFDTFLQKNRPAEFIVAPVTYHNRKSFLEQFQFLDFLSLQGTTIGAFGINKPFLCNGANLCYSQQIFNEVNGFEGNENIASGDDIFLLEKAFKKHPKKVQYLKATEAIVRTNPQPTFKELLQQRIRWAAKSTGYSNNFSKLVALSVLSMNALLIILFVLSVIGYFNWLYLLIFFLLKFLIDAILLLKASLFFGQTKALASYFLSSFIYPFFSMFVVIASLTSGYQWKGKAFKQ